MTRSIDDGGPAFSRTAQIYPDGAIYDSGHDGMTLRDYFAAKAIQGLLANDSLGAGLDTFDFCSRATTAFKMADAMLKERAK